MIEVSLLQILGIAAAVITPLLTAITVLWKSLQRAYADKDAMRTAMQQKIDDLTQKAIDAINFSTNQANSFSTSLVSLNAIVQKQVEQWPQFKTELLDSIRDILK